MTTDSRITILYGGVEYATSGRTLDDVAAELAAGAAGNTPSWFEARLGHGRSTPVRLLLGPGIPIAISEVNRDGESAPRDEEAAGIPGTAPSADVV